MGEAGFLPNLIDEAIADELKVRIRKMNRP